MTHPPQTGASRVWRKCRPGSVTLAATLQLLAAVAFLIYAAVVLVYGADAQAAAEAEVARQGLPADVLAQNGVRFDEGGAATMFPVAVALGLATLALLNLAGSRVGRVLSWIFQPIALVAEVLILVSQLSVARVLESTFERSGDATLRSIDVQALIDAAQQASPAWLPYVVFARSALATLGSLLVIALLAVPSAKAYFRKDSP